LSLVYDVDPETERELVRQKIRKRGERIKAHRERRGLTVHGLAKLIGATPSTVRSWERGDSQPMQRRTMDALLCILGVTLKDL
jgi:DNA-binding transcriptional regulator YiaG